MRDTQTKYNKIAILGFGITGQSAIRYFSQIGVKEIHVFERQTEEAFSKNTLAGSFRLPGVDIHFGSDVIENISDFDMLMASPGIPLSHPSIQAALKNNVTVHNDITYFLKEWRKIGPIVGVTGSNGKSTTVSLLHHVLNTISRPNILVGNIGNSPLADLLKEHKPGTIVITELSSYQLELFKNDDYVDIAVITNLTENHLDRYEGKMQLYADAKMKIAHPDATELILVTDDAGTQKYILPKVNKKMVQAISLSDLSSEAQQFADPENRALKGEHNLYNIAMVVEVLKKLDIKIDAQVAEAIRTYAGLEHRLEFVRELDGVRYINDSKSTSADSMRVALEALGDQKNIVLLAGGSDKGGTFNSVSDHFNQYVKFIVTLDGYDSTVKKIRDTATKNGIETAHAMNMAEAVKIARDHAKTGDTVLLSPGGGHIFHLANFEVSGRTFKEEVNKL